MSFLSQYRAFIRDHQSFTLERLYGEARSDWLRRSERVARYIGSHHASLSPYVCDDCGAIHDTNHEGISTDTDGIICGDCADEYCWCEYCETYHHHEDFRHVVREGRNSRAEDSQACNEEIDSAFFLADDGHYYPESTRVSTWDGNGAVSTLSSDYEDNWYGCYTCGDAVHVDDAHHDDDGDTYCPNHAPASRGDHPYPLYGYHSAGRPRTQAVYAGTEPPALGARVHALYGVEIETTNERGEDATLDVLAQFDADEEHTHFWAEEDGSLNHGGVEIVTQPHSLAAFREQPWEQLFGALTKAGARSWDDSSCGQHIHVCRRAFQGLLHQAKFATFLSLKENLPFVEWAAGRRQNGYAMSPDTDGTATLSKIARRQPGTRTIVRGDGAKYRVVNLMHKDTIEFRLPKGTLNYQTFLKNLEFVDAVRNFTRDAKLTDLTAPAFFDYVVKHRKAYPALVAWMSTHQDRQPHDCPATLDLARVALVKDAKQKALEQAEAAHQAALRAAMERAASARRQAEIERLAADLAEYDEQTTPPAELRIGMVGRTRAGLMVELHSISPVDELYCLSWRNCPGYSLASFTTTRDGRYYTQANGESPEYSSDIVAWLLPPQAAVQPAQEPTPESAPISVGDRVRLAPGVTPGGLMASAVDDELIDALMTGQEFTVGHIGSTWARLETDLTHSNAVELRHLVRVSDEPALVAPEPTPVVPEPRVGMWARTRSGEVVRLCGIAPERTYRGQPYPLGWGTQGQLPSRTTRTDGTFNHNVYESPEDIVEWDINPFQVGDRVRLAPHVTDADLEGIGILTGTAQRLLDAESMRVSRLHEGYVGVEVPHGIGDWFIDFSFLIFAN